MNDNIAQQEEELEVLMSIFGEQWQKCIKLQNRYSIKVSKDVELWITLHDAYPSDEPPQYEVCAPNLSRCQKDLIDKEFREIFEMDKGFPIIFQWIEKLKEFMEGQITVTSQETTSDQDECEKTSDQDECEKTSDQDECVSDGSTNETCNKRETPIYSTLDITHGPTITDRKSTFQGHACQITQPHQIDQLLETLLENKKIRDAKHNILAYRIVTDKNIILQDCDDDGETHAGGRLLHLLDILDVKNVAVVVTRWYGGIHLGPDRFKHINNAGRQALMEAGFIK